MRSLRIGNKVIGEKNPVFIIAEAGVNHNGRLDLALELIDVAARAGADAVKFQTFAADQVVIPSAKLVRYQRKNTGKRMSQRDLLKQLEMPADWYPKLIDRARARGIIFLSTPHGGTSSLLELARYKVPAFKFGSGDLTNIPLLARAAQMRKPMLISTGMATLEEVKDAYGAVRKTGNNKVVLMHATADYPCPPQEVNIRAITTLRKLGTLVGYSDHSQGSEASIAAVALGACVLEKHFTLDRSLPGPDHQASMEPAELEEFVQSIRTASKMLGTGTKTPQQGEREARKSARKSIVTAARIRRGERFSPHNLAIKRPGTGLAPKLISSVVGKRASRDIPADMLLKRSDIL